MEEELKREILELVRGALLQDSIEIGTPAKGGGLKIYVNFENEELTTNKIKRAVTALKLAQNEIKEMSD